MPQSLRDSTSRLHVNMGCDNHDIRGDAVHSWRRKSLAVPIWNWNVPHQKSGGSARYASSALDVGEPWEMAQVMVWTFGDAEEICPDVH